VIRTAEGTVVAKYHDVAHELSFRTPAVRGVIAVAVEEVGNELQ